MSDVRLIDANALRKIYCEYFYAVDPENPGDDVLAVRDCVMALDAAPAVDAVEVVRCKECKNSGMMVPIGGKKPHRICWMNDLQVNDKDFCSRGARMDAQTDQRPETGEGEKA